MSESQRHTALRVNSNGKLLRVDKLFILLSLLAEVALDPMLTFIGSYFPLTPGRAAARKLSKFVSARPQG
jgi:hypothetical protein